MNENSEKYVVQDSKLEWRDGLKILFIMNSFYIGHIIKELQVENFWFNVFAIVIFVSLFNLSVIGVFFFIEKFSARISKQYDYWIRIFMAVTMFPTIIFLNVYSLEFLKL